MCVCMYLHAVCMNCDIVEAHCYIVITSELILMSKFVAESINQTTNCRMFLARCRPSSTAYKTVFCTRLMIEMSFNYHLLRVHVGR